MGGIGTEIMLLARLENHLERASGVLGKFPMRMAEENDDDEVLPEFH